MGLDEQIMRNLRKRKYQVPTPIQKCVIPILMDEHLQECKHFDLYWIRVIRELESGKSAVSIFIIWNNFSLFIIWILFVNSR